MLQKESKGNKNGKDEEDNNLQTAPMYESKRVKSMIKGETQNPRSKKTQITVAWQRVPTRMRKKFTGIDERTDEYNDEYRDKDKVSGLRFTQDCENFQCDNNANTAIIELIHKPVCLMKNLKK